MKVAAIALGQTAVGRRRFFYLLAVLVGAGVILWIWRIRPAGRGDQDAQALVSRGDIVESVYGIGTVTAAKSFQLKPGTTNTVERLHVREGDQVRRGDPLVDMDGVRFKAPFNGTVTRLPVKVGEAVFVGTVIMSLVDLSDRYVVVSLEQRAALRVRRGQEARLSFEGLREKSEAGVVESVYSQDGGFLVRIAAPRLPPEILPDMTADVAIVIGGKKGVLLAPVAALSEGGLRVARRGRKSALVPVETGLVDGEFLEITGGEVREGDRLILPRGVAP